MAQAALPLACGLLSAEMLELIRLDEDALRKAVQNAEAKLQDILDKIEQFESLDGHVAVFHSRFKDPMRCKLVPPKGTPARYVNGCTFELVDGRFAAYCHAHLRRAATAGYHHAYGVTRGEAEERLQKILSEAVKRP